MVVGRRNDLDAISFKAVTWLLAIAGVVLLIAPTLVVLIVSFTIGLFAEVPAARAIRCAGTTR